MKAPYRVVLDGVQTNHLLPPPATREFRRIRKCKANDPIEAGEMALAKQAKSFAGTRGITTGEVLIAQVHLLSLNGPVNAEWLKGDDWKLVD